MHFPWSPGLQNDDRMLESADVFLGKEVVITEKFDGENTSIYTDHIHARSLDSQKSFIEKLGTSIRGSVSA